LLDIILPVTARRAGLVNDAAVTSTVPRYALERIAAPTLAIGVADDLFGTCDSARYTAREVPGAQLVEFPAGGHVWIGHNDEVMAAVIDFVKAHAGAAAPAG
jgi:pimeloyl-ACP methyl ester carboxylesterase